MPAKSVKNQLGLVVSSLTENPFGPLGATDTVPDATTGDPVRWMVRQQRHDLDATARRDGLDAVAEESRPSLGNALRGRKSGLHCLDEVIDAGAKQIYTACPRPRTSSAAQS